MTYKMQLFKLLFAVDDHIFRIRKAEEIKSLWRVIIYLALVSIVIYSAMGVWGFGTDIISRGAVDSDPATYELRKVWFVIGRASFSVLFVSLVLFLPSIIFYWVTKIPYKKLVLMQVIVLFVMLLERVIWIPLHLYLGLDWYVSPLSFGVIASYFTDISFLIYLFGAISLFQIWIILFQIKFLTRLSGVHKGWIYSVVILFHAATWTVTATLAFTDILMINGWFA